MSAPDPTYLNDESFLDGYGINSECELVIFSRDGLFECIVGRACDARTFCSIIRIGGLDESWDICMLRSRIYTSSAKS